MSRAGGRAPAANRGTRPRRPQRYDADSLLEVAVRVFDVDTQEKVAARARPASTRVDVAAGSVTHSTIRAARVPTSPTGA